MKRFLNKVRGDKKGFTLAELLVVVAIIAILVAVSIPIFTAQLSKARKATNQANLRAAKAAAVAAYLTDEAAINEAEVYYTYNISDGTVTEGNANSVKDWDIVESTNKNDTVADISTTEVYKNIGIKIKADSKTADDILNTATTTLYAK